MPCWSSVFKILNSSEIIPNDNLFESYENITEEVEVKPEPKDINKDLNQETNELDIFANDSLVKDSNSEVIHDLNDLTNDYVETNRTNRFITSEDKAEIKSEVKNEEIPSESYNIFGDDPFGLEAKKNDNQKENVQSSIVSENKENDIVDVSSKVETVDIEPEALNVEPIATEPKEETNKKEVIVEATKIKEKKKSKLPLVLVIIALILVGVAGVVFYFYTKTSPDKIFTSALNKLTLENSAIDNVRENLSFSICSIFVSSSIHITFPAFSSKYFVSVPSPGPISITKSCLSILLQSTMFVTTSSFIKKFCPRFLFAFMLYFFIINLVSSNIFSIWCPFYFYIFSFQVYFYHDLQTVYLLSYRYTKITNNRRFFLAYPIKTFKYHPDARIQRNVIRL